jgi:hypothetical protein
MLKFLCSTNAPFIVNPYPYFTYSSRMMNYTPFKRNACIHNKFTGITYTNMLDAPRDALH